MRMLRRACIVLIALLTAWAVAAPTAQAGSDHGRWPSRIDLPNGFQPEGITIGDRPIAYLGSLANGDIYAADLRTGTGRVISEGPGTASVGMKIDHRGRLFVAGGPAGNARMISVRTGGVLARWNFGSTPTFVNDVVLTERWAWFTDSQQPYLYGVPIRRDGTVGGDADVRKLRLSGDWTQQDGFNANGIARTPDGKALLVVSSVAASLYRVDPQTGSATKVDLGGVPLTNGDGLLVTGRTLFVVQNQLNRVAKFVLDRRGCTGRFDGIQTSPDFSVPTTVAAYGHRLYLPNAKFGVTPPSSDYWVTAIPRF